jgi:hypothetical protein
MDAQRRMNARCHISPEFITSNGKKNRVIETLTNRVPCGFLHGKKASIQAVDNFVRFLFD